MTLKMRRPSVGLEPTGGRVIDLELPQGDDEQELARKIEAELARRQRARDFPNARFATKRFLIRTTRIAIGGALMVFALWLFGLALEQLERPFSSLSPLGLIGGLLAGFFGFLVTMWSFWTAFGEGESREMHDAQLEGSMRVRIEDEFRWRAARAEELRSAAIAARDREHSGYKFGKALGKFFKGKAR